MSNETTNPDEYNGWINRETWALNLWLSNDQGLYGATMEVADAAAECHKEDMLAVLYDDENEIDCTFAVGESILEWFDNDLREIMDATAYSEMREDIGSLYRVDAAELGAAWTDTEE